MGHWAHLHSGSLSRRMFTCDITLTRGARETMLTETTRCLAVAVETGYNFPVHVDHLALCVNSKARARIVNNRGRPGGIERRLRDFI